MSIGFRRFAVLISVLTLGGCGGEGGSLQVISEVPVAPQPAIGASLALEQEVSFDFDFTAQLEKEIASDGSDDNSEKNFQTKALSPDVLTGVMFVENLETGESESYPWSILVDGNFFQNPTSLTTVALRPGNYTFTLSVLNGEHQYVGTTFHQLQEDRADFVPMLIKPVIGDSLVDVTIADSLIEFGFGYTPNEIAAAGLVDPVVSISVDGGFEQHFVVNPVTGLSDVAYMGLPPGNYNFSIKLFDQGYQIGRSVEEQNFVTVSTGLDISMDIVPLYGEMRIDLFAEGTDADVVVQVPAEVVDEAGGLVNLDAVLRVVGPNSPFHDLPLVLSQVGADYEATVTLPQMAYDELTFEMSFFDLARGKIIGNCINTAPNTLSGITVTCPVLLQSTASIGGSFLSTVGVNVFDTLGNPVAGAVVKVDGIEAGITANSPFSTPGYSKLFVKPGERVISAEIGPELGEVLYDSIPLNVTNVSVMLGDTVSLSTPILMDDFSGVQTGIAAPTNYIFGCVGLGTSQGGVSSYETLVLWSKNVTNDFCSGTGAVTDRSFTDPEIINANGFQVSVDVVWAENADSEVTIGIGEEAGFDVFNFMPAATADATVTVRDNEIEVNVYEAGVAVSSTTHATPFTAAVIDNIKIDVETGSFAPGSPALLRVYVNSDPNFVPPIAFNWDGGNNHIELRGGAFDPASGNGAWVELDNLVIRPR